MLPGARLTPWGTTRGPQRSNCGPKEGGELGSFSRLQRAGVACSKVRSLGLDLMRSAKRIPEGTGCRKRRLGVLTRFHFALPDSFLGSGAQLSIGRSEVLSTRPDAVRRIDHYTCMNHRRMTNTCPVATRRIPHLVECRMRLRVCLTSSSSCQHIPDCIVPPKLAGIK